MKTLNYQSLQNCEAYTLAFELSNRVWKIVARWYYFETSTLGIPLVRKIDAISSLLAEGMGKSNKDERISCFEQSLGSLQESQDLVEKAKCRELFCEEDYLEIRQSLELLPEKLYSLIEDTIRDEKFNTIAVYNK